MKRAAARLGLLVFLGGVPFVLRSLLGSPGLPDFGASGGLSDSYLPVEAVLEVLGLLAWALWAYLTFAVLLHGVAVVAASRGAGPHRGLLAASSLLTPRTLRNLVEFAVSGTVLAASFSVRVAASHPLPAGAPTVRSVDVTQMGEEVTAVAERRVKEMYRVRPGDSLWRIAERELGSGFRWREIYRLNQGKRFSDGRCLTSPHLIYAGWVLELPGDGRASPPRSGRDEPNDRPAGQEHETPPPPTPPPEPIETQVPPTEPSQQEPDPDQEADEPETPVPANPALRTPSGLLVAASFASGLLTAHLLGRLRRRRARRLSVSESAEPAPTPELIQDFRRAGASEMTGPLDVALDAVIEAWRAETGSWPHVLAAVEGSGHVDVILEAGDVPPPRSFGGSLSPLVRFTRGGSSVVAEVEGPFPTRLRPLRSPLERGLLLPLGRAPDGAAVHVSATGLGQLSISGPQAGSLVRQLVLSAATQGGPEDLRVVLLGPGDEVTGLGQLPQAEGSYGWEEASGALRVVQLELVRRARLFMDEGVEDIRGHLAEHSDDRLPALLVVCEEPPSALRGLVQALAKEGLALGAAVVVLGWPPRGCRLRIQVGATVEVETDLPCPKIVEPLLLDAGAERQAIEVIREASPPEAAEEPTTDEAVEAVEEEELPLPVEPPPEQRPYAKAELPLPLPPVEPPGPPPDMMAVRCLGPYEISRGEKPLPTGWKTKGRELVAYLVAHPAGAPKERIVEELWPEIDPELGAGRFDRYATIIRTQARGTEDSRMYVERAGDSYRLQEDAWWVDAWEFERLVREAQRTEDVAKLRNAVALHRGEFCDDAYYPWLEGTRERLRNLFTDACGCLADLLARVDNHEEALSILDRAIAADPVCEDLVRRAMTIEAAIGRRAAALDRYRKFEVTLDKNLGVEPDPETQAYVRRLMGAKEKAG